MSESKSMYDLFGTSEDKEVAGEWFNYGPAGSIKLARAGGANKLYQTTMERVFRPHRKQIQLDNLDPTLLDDLFQEVYARSIVLAWKGVKDRDGKDIPFSAENVIKLFKDLPDFWVEIRDQASNPSNFRDGDDEEDEKN